MARRKEEEDFDEMEKRSQISNYSRTSRQSVANTLALIARAKAEAGRAEFAFAREDAELMKQQAILNTSLHELKLARAAAAASAEAESLEAAAEEEYELSNSLHENVAMQIPIIRPVYQPNRSAKADDTVNSVTFSQSDARPQTTTNSPVHQPSMDISEAKRFEKQGNASSSEISDHEFIEPTRHHSPGGEVTWIPSQSPMLERQTSDHSCKRLCPGVRVAANCLIND
ncbi:hypothetical protein E1301_Tti017114 [Triplophysa tibetana]|uniref:Uncharacterized protein n=1 Tax=Triplophysa tibetana TaxID=1572043 RepID=A0A5A9NXX2_9TELE|nr:hypothetical protein E1301_Tti017114 [Triplophysa tibetana]